MVGWVTPPPPPPLAQALPCLSTGTGLTVIFPTALFGFLLWELLTISLLAQGGGGWLMLGMSNRHFLTEKFKV